MRVIARELIETIILALFIFLLLHLAIGNRRVEGPSMEPTLANGERVIVNKLTYLHFDPLGNSSFLPFVASDNADKLFTIDSPERGDIVVFRHPPQASRDFVKRIIGMPGDTIEMKQGVVFINGSKLHEPYVAKADLESMESRTVPANSYFVLGDNRRASNDSRVFGTVPLENIIGRAWIRFWPLDRFKTMNISNLP